MTTRVMVDIETLGLEPGAAILSIGAVGFDTNGPTGETFHRQIRLSSCQAAGLEIDAETLAWWLDQDDAAKDVLTGGDDLESVLTEFVEWYPDDADEIWANSPAFDCAILERAGGAVGVGMPWAFYEQRDVRTIRSLPAAVELDRTGIEHDALDDAIHQAREIAATLEALHQ